MMTAKRRSASRGNLLLALLGITALIAVVACGGNKKRPSLCSGSADCPSGQVCENGVCIVTTATADTSGSDTSTDDAGSDGSENTTDSGDDTSTENACTDGDKRCDPNTAGFYRCENGQWTSTLTPCPSTPCQGSPSVDNSGVTPGLCVDGSGCLLTSCEACANNLMVDVTTNECRSSCQDAGVDKNELCWPGFICQSGKCVSGEKKGLGLPCVAGDECESSFCARLSQNGEPAPTAKVCCNAECKNPCEVCGADGQCTLLLAGKPDAERCPAEDPSTCGRNGFCTHDGLCENWPDDTICKDPYCTSDTEYPASKCLAGKCEPPSGSSCAQGFTCKGSICDNKPCTAHSDCADVAPAGTYYCAKDPNNPTSSTGICAKKKPNLETCDGLAIDDVDGNACTSGTCAKDDFEGHNATFVCVGTNACNWAGTSALKEGTIRCSGINFSLVCKASSWTGKKSCTSGPCEGVTGDPNSGFIAQGCTSGVGCNTTCATCPDGLKADSSGCKNSCSTDADCQATHYCRNGSCNERGKDGDACTAANQCGAGLYCVEAKDETKKICCPENCSGNCNYCADLGGKYGCKDRIGEADKYCKNKTDPICGVATCKGTNSCGFPDSKTGCGDPVCKNSAIYEYNCDGNGVCAETKTGDCAFGCKDANSCKDACTEHAECGSGKYCAKSGTCQTVLADGTSCYDKSIKGTTDGAVCKNGVCAADNLELKDSNGNVINHKGGYFCAKSGECVDSTLAGGTALTFLKGHYRCDTYAQTDANGNKLGVAMYVCDGKKWVLPSQIGGKYDICATNASTGTYGGCNPIPGTSYYKGWTSITCTEGIPGGCNQSCSDCGNYTKNPSSTAKCYSACSYAGKPLGTTLYSDTRCDTEVAFCCKGSDTKCKTAGKCETKKGGYYSGNTSTSWNCNRSLQCKGPCVNWYTITGYPLCACTSDSHCPSNAPYCRCNLCSANPNLLCSPCSGSCGANQIKACNKSTTYCFDICSDASCPAVIL